MWLSIRLPQLPLKALLTKKVKGVAVQAVIDENRVICVNQTASQLGIAVGQTVTHAFALCETIKLYQRKPQQEQQLLNNLAITLYPISSSVIVEKNGIVILEIAKSLKLYKGLNALLSQVRYLLDNQSSDYQIAIGHSPTSAEILSFMPLAYSMRAITNKEQIDLSHLNQLISKLSIQSMLIEDKVIKQFQSVGFKNIGELKKIPHASLQKRFGKKTLNYLLKLFNQQADPRDYFQPQENFHQSLEFNEVVHHRQGLLFPIKRLLNHLVNFLHLHQKNAHCLRWQLFDTSKSSLEFKVVFSNSQISLNNYLELTQLNLEHYQLKEPIEGIALTADQLTSLNIETQALFEQVGAFKNNSHFMNKIRAKLGEKSCSQLTQKSHHLPEHASKLSAEVSINPDKKTKIPQQNDKPKESHIARVQPPTWLFSTPKPIRLIKRKLIFNGELKIVSPPQKIASYWWVNSSARDYYIAEHETGSLYWVFLDRLSKHWFLHGVYG